MTELHLIKEARLSEVAGKQSNKGLPCDIWALEGSLPDGIELDEPHPIILEAVDSFRPLEHEEHLVYSLAYEEFEQIRAIPSVQRISKGLKSNPQGTLVVLAAKALATMLGYEVRLYETCDY